MCKTTGPCSRDPLAQLLTFSSCSKNTALHLACERMHRDCIKALVMSGAEIGLANTNNKVCYETVGEALQRREIENFTKV